MDGGCLLGPARDVVDEVSARGCQRAVAVEEG